MSSTLGAGGAGRDIRLAAHRGRDFRPCGGGQHRRPRDRVMDVMGGLRDSRRGIIISSWGKPCAHHVSSLRSSPLSCCSGGLLVTQPASGAASATVSGRITDASGKPLAGVTVAVWDTSRDGSPPYAAYRATSAADGTYSVAVAPDEYFVCAGGIVGQAFRVDQNTAASRARSRPRTDVTSASAPAARTSPWTSMPGAPPSPSPQARRRQARTLPSTTRHGSAARCERPTAPRSQRSECTATDGPHLENHVYDDRRVRHHRRRRSLRDRGAGPR